MIEYFRFNEIKKNKKIGRNINQTANFLGLDRKTVKKYWDMTNYEFFKMTKRDRDFKRKSRCEKFKPKIVEIIKDINEISTSGIYDRLLELYGQEVNFSERTLRNYVNQVRKELKIPKSNHQRDYQAVEELPPGKQAQVDFGELRMRCAWDVTKRKKIYFFLIVLRFSRFKYVEFSDKKFTAEMAIQAHKRAFKYFGGIPIEIVYDQDSVFIVSENQGDIMATAKFRSFLASMPFTHYVARPADPETKGCIEKYIFYVKNNFLYGRLFEGIEKLNEDGLKWLERTGNNKICQTTNEKPVDRLALEQQALLPFNKNLENFVFNEIITHKVNKDNTITYRGNRYRVPVGTYNKVRNHEVGLFADHDNNRLFILDLLSHNQIISHPLAQGKGHLVGQKEQKPLSSASSKELINTTAAFIPYGVDPSTFLNQVCLHYERYIPEQMKLISSAIKKQESVLSPTVLQNTLDSCLSLKLYSGHDFKKLLDNFCEFSRMDQPVAEIPEEWEDSLQVGFNETNNPAELDRMARLASLWEIVKDEREE